MKTFLWIIGGILGITLLSIGIKIIFFPVNTAERMIDTVYDAQKKVINANNAIYNYEWFKQQKEDIDAMGKKYKNADESLKDFLEIAGNRENWNFEDKNEYNRLNSIKLGIQNQLEDMIATYNARSKMATRNIFEDSVLPNYVDALLFIKQ